MRNLDFVDLFAGIGGMRLGFEATGGRCVFSSEIDRAARETYEDNFGDEPHGDIRLIEADQVPRHDILLAGFPITVTPSDTLEKTTPLDATVAPSPTETPCSTAELEPIKT